MVTEEQRERWRAKAQKRERQLERSRAWLRYWKEQGPVRYVLIMGVLLYGLPLALLNERVLTWNRPEVWWPVRPYPALLFLAAGVIYCLVLWAITMRAARKRGDFALAATTGDRAGADASVPSAPAGSDLAKPVQVRRLVALFACYWVVVLAVVWVLPYFLHPVPGGRIDRWQLGVEHPEPDAVYFGSLDGTARDERRERLKEACRCISEPQTPPREDFLCGKPAEWVVHYATRIESLRGDVHLAVDPVHESSFWPVCESHREQVEARFEQRAREERARIAQDARDPDPDESNVLRTVACAQWITPPMKYDSRSVQDDPLLPEELQ